MEDAHASSNRQALRICRHRKGLRRARPVILALGRVRSARSCRLKPPLDPGADYSSNCSGAADNQVNGAACTPASWAPAGSPARHATPACQEVPPEATTSTTELHNSGELRSDLSEEDAPNMGMAGRRQPAAEMEELQSMTARGAPPRSEACRKNHGDATKTGRANVNAFSAVGRLVLYGKLVGADWSSACGSLQRASQDGLVGCGHGRVYIVGFRLARPALADRGAGVCGRADGACPLPWGHCILGCLGGRVVCSWYDAPG